MHKAKKIYKCKIPNTSNIYNVYIYIYCVFFSDIVTFFAEMFIDIDNGHFSGYWNFKYNNKIFLCIKIVSNLIKCSRKIITSQ